MGATTQLILALLWSLTAAALAASATVWTGIRRLRRCEREAGGEPDPGSWPQVALVVPAQGASPELRECLLSLLRQDYPDYRITVSVRDATDPAHGIVSALMAADPAAGSRMNLVVAGNAVRCGQKNRNLLAGVEASAASARVLVFCDAERLAGRDWLRAMVRPLARGAAQVAAGYHVVHSTGTGLLSVGRAIVVTVLRALQSLRFSIQTWGGATAIDRSLFESLNVADLWGQTVVDDVPLAARLRRSYVPVWPVLSPALATRGPRDTLTSWCGWMVRQIQWLAYSFRVLWLAGGLLGIAETLATTAAPWIAAAWLAGAVSDGIGFWSAVHLGSATVALLALRAAHPTRVAVWRWLAAGYAVLPLLAACYARTLCARRVLWRDTRYRVDRHGRVMAVQSRPAAERQTPDGQPRD